MAQTPLPFFRKYFSDEVFEDAANFTNHYSIVTSVKIINTNAGDLKLFFVANLIIGRHFLYCKCTGKQGISIPQYLILIHKIVFCLWELFPRCGHTYDLPQKLKIYMEYLSFYWHFKKSIFTFTTRSWNIFHRLTNNTIYGSLFS